MGNCGEMMEANKLNELLEWLNDFDNKPIKPTYANMREKVWQLIGNQSVLNTESNKKCSKSLCFTGTNYCYHKEYNNVAKVCDGKDYECKFFTNKPLTP